MGPVLAVDMGGTKISVGIVDSSGTILAIETEPTCKNSPQATVGQALALANRLSGAKNTRALGLALPGVMDADRRVLVDSPSSGWKDVPFVALFEKAFGLPAAADNDAKACALAEWRFGAARGLADFFWMTVSTGVGGAFFANGKLARGARGMAGEIGHLLVRPGGRLCTCGNRGCLEAEAAGPSWADRAREIDPDWKADAAAIAGLARSGDTRALSIVEDVADALACGIAAVVNLLDPQAVFFGGGVAGAADLLFPRIQRGLEGKTLRSPAGPDFIRRSAFGHEAALAGAACLALEIAQRNDVAQRSYAFIPEV